MPFLMLFFYLYTSKWTSSFERRSCVDPLFSHWTQKNREEKNIDDETMKEYEIYNDDVDHSSHRIYNIKTEKITI